MTPALALLALMQAGPLPPPTEDEVVVTARKMRMIRVDIKAPRRGGVLVVERCRITRSSNDAEIDAVPCLAAQACVADRVASRKALGHCVAERSRPLLDAIVARRRAARGDQS